MRPNPSLFRQPFKRAALNAALASLIAMPPVMAAEPKREEKLFDPPSANQELDGTGESYRTEALRCHWYKDVMIRETQTDSPGWGPSYVVSPSPGGGAPLCRAAPTARDIKLNVSSQALIGRKGPYLIFEATDASGPEPFVVLYLPDGHKVYEDMKSGFDTKTSEAGLHAVTLQGDALHLNYLRAYDAACSLVQDGEACWTKAMKQGHFARAIAAQPPPIADCRAVYKANGEPANSGSTIVYDVDMTLTSAGKATVLSRGPVGCAPSP